MEQRRFGDSDLVCSALGFGTWELSTTDYGKIDVKEAQRAAQEAIDHGITLFDTAEAYGPYLSEELLGKALASRRSEVVLVTKVGFAYEGNRFTVTDSSFDNVVTRAEGCLRRLGTDWIDLLLIHWPDHDIPYAEPIAALEKLKQDGKIRHYGVSNFSPAMMEVCESAGHLTANQVGYNLFDRRMERAVLPYAKAHGIGFMAYGTLCYGLLTGAFTESTTFLDWDWRSGGRAFGLPLFRREQFLKELRVVEAAQGDRRAPRPLGSATRHRVGPGPPGGYRGAGGRAPERGTEGERGGGRLAPLRRGPGADRPRLRGGGSSPARRHPADGGEHASGLTRGSGSDRMSARRPDGRPGQAPGSS